MNCIRLLGAALFSFAILATQSACTHMTGQSSYHEALVSEIGEDFLRRGPAAGLSIGILQHGVARTYHYGEYDRITHHTPQDESRYAIASVTKTFTATLLARAVMDGKAHLDDDLRRYLDGDYQNLQFRGHPITLGHLANHNSGLPYMLPVALAPPTPGSGESDAARTLRERDLLQDYLPAGFLSDLHAVEISAQPGTRFQYSNAALVLLGMVLERIYGMPYEALVRREITVPLRMVDTKITLTPRERRRLRGHDAAGAVVLHNGELIAPAAGLNSSLRDMMKYLRWHLAERDPAVRLTHESAWQIDGTYSIGLNWQMFSLPGYRMIWQEGAVPGFASYCVIYPELDLGIIVLVNELDPATPSRLGDFVKRLTRVIEPRFNLP